MSVLSHWIWLSRLHGVMPGTTMHLLQRFGSPLEIYNAKKNTLEKTEGIGAGEMTSLMNKDLREAERILSDCAKHGINIVTFQDAAYPERLAAIYDPPIVLYIKGKLPPLDMYPSIGVVGTRKSTPYGLLAAKEISYYLSKAGIIIISGMALGSDAAAHSGALEALKPTVAVLGCGLDTCYPPENRALYEDIPRRGALVSEYPPGTKPLAAHFPARNRIISGLSQGVLVTEAAKGSGALITVSHALEQGREVYAVPGNIDNPLSSGTNELIKQGAKLVSSYLDILEDLLPLYPEILDTVAEDAKPSKGQDEYVPSSDRKARKIYTPGYPTIAALTKDEKTADGAQKTKNSTTGGLSENIMSLLTQGDMYQDDIIAILDVSSSEINAALTILELEGKIISRPGNIFGLK